MFVEAGSIPNNLGVQKPCKQGNGGRIQDVGDNRVPPPLSSSGGAKPDAPHQAPVRVYGILGRSGAVLVGDLGDPGATEEEKSLEIASEVPVLLKTKVFRLRLSTYSTSYGSRLSNREDSQKKNIVSTERVDYLSEEIVILTQYRLKSRAKNGANRRSADG